MIIARKTSAVYKGLLLFFLAGELLKFLNNLKPMTRLEKKERRKAMAAAGTTEAEYRPQVKFGLNHVTTVVEKKEAQLVVIAHGKYFLFGPFFFNHLICNGLAIFVQNI